MARVSSDHQMQCDEARLLTRAGLHLVRYPFALRGAVEKPGFTACAQLLHQRRLNLPAAGQRLATVCHRAGDAAVLLTSPNSVLFLVSPRSARDCSVGPLSSTYTRAEYIL